MGNFNNLSSGDWIHLCEENFDDHYSETGYVGQITQLESGSTSLIVMKDEASKSYSSANNLWVKEIDPVKNIGFENFKIQRTNTTKGYGVNIKFSYSVNCWVKGIESYNCTGYHISCSHSSHIEINGCYIHHATNYDSHEGTGYGVSLGTSTTNCLIENNIFTKLRHAMIVGMGANCNVFAYNYSREQTWDYDWLVAGPDICLHGRYPYANLFEENVVDQIMADASHGLNGPYNTFLRNKTNSETYVVLCYADYTNVIGNNRIMEVLTTYNRIMDNLIDAGFSWDDIFAILGFIEGADVDSDHVIDIYFNCYPEAPDWDYGWVEYSHGLWYVQSQDTFYFNFIYYRSFLNDISYFYDDRPEFLTSSYSCPSNGPNINLDYNNVIEGINLKIPAEDRYLNSIKTYNPNPTKHPLSAPVLSISGTWGEHPTLLWVDGGEPDIDHFVLKKQYTNDSGTWITYVDPAPNPYIDTYMTSEKFGSTVANYWVKSVDIGNYESLYSNKRSTVGQGPEWEKVPKENLVEILIPGEFVLYENYPNPFNPITTIRFGLPESQKVELSIYDVGGNKVKTLLRDVVPAGYHQVQWDGKDGLGKQVPSGIYIYRMSSDNKNLVKKMILTK